MKLLTIIATLILALVALLCSGVAAFGMFTERLARNAARKGKGGKRCFQPVIDALAGRSPYKRWADLGLPALCGGAGTLSEQFSIVYVLKPGDYQAGGTGESINMGKLHRVMYILQFATLTGDGVLTLKSGASDGVQTTSETFRYRVSTGVQAAASADIFGSWTSASTLTLTAADYTNKALILEIEASALTQGQPWLTLAFSAAADALNASVIAIGEPRYQSITAPTVLT